MKRQLIVTEIYFCPSIGDIIIKTLSGCIIYTYGMHRTGER